MVYNNNKSSIIDDDFHDLPYLEYDEQNIFHEWYLIEGEGRISELSRQLRTFFNYKQSIIHVKFSKLRKYAKNSYSESISRHGNDLITHTSRFIGLLKNIGVEDGNIIETLKIHMKKLVLNPKRADIDKLHEIKKEVKKIWEILHVLSELGLYNNQSLLKTAIKISCISCEVNSALFTRFGNFYGELNKNYLQLERELIKSEQFDKQDQLPVNKRKIGVAINK
ncbi:MAG: hypothetical protein HWN80_19785 [Candidatus Lokiarchaeota archaeon]|nr:hypothetical protein [Candidatus Lokiarchaeota archaeon]